MKMYRRNSRKNPWRNTRKSNYNKRKIQGKSFLGMLLTISIPLMIICISANVVLRVSDTYQYNLRSTQALTEVNRLVDEEELITLFGDFMIGKTDEFSLQESAEYKPEDLFTNEEKKAMIRGRKIVNIYGIVGMAMTLLTVAIYFFLIRWREKMLLMMNMQRSGLVLLVGLIVHGLLLVVPTLWKKTWGNAFPYHFETNDVLLSILGKEFLIQITIFQTIISIILFGILAYGTWEVAGKKRLFKTF